MNHDHHNQQSGKQCNEKPVDFERDALIDTGASFSSLKNVQPLNNVVTTEEPIAVVVNAGELGGFKAKMWKDTTGTTNVLSL